MERFFTQSFPQSYPVQPFFRFCGAFQLSAIASVNGLIINPYDVFDGWTGVTGFCSPRVLFRKAKQLFHHATYHQGTCALDDIKKQMQAGKYIILLIGLAYNQHGTGCNLFRAIASQHYVSLWGYDDDGFFVYDSAVRVNNNLPVGNVYVKNDVLLRCWKRGGVGFYPQTFISIG